MHDTLVPSPRKGDILYSVNGRSLADLSLLDAFQLFRSLPPGPIRIRGARLQSAYVQVSTLQLCFFLHTPFLDVWVVLALGLSVLTMDWTTSR